MDEAYLAKHLHLSEETRDEIGQCINAIRSNHITGIKLRIMNGHYARQIKALVGHGGWLNWLLQQNVGYYSPRTVERDMMMAASLYDRIDEIEDSMVNLTALFKLCSPSANEDAIGAAMELMRQGQRIGGKQAEQVEQVLGVEPALMESVIEGRMTLEDAHHVAGELEGAPLEVISTVLKHNVRSSVVANALKTLHEQEPETFAEIAVSGTIWNPSLQADVPLSGANMADIDAAFNEVHRERELRHAIHINQWKEKHGERLAKFKGTREMVISELSALLGDDDNQVVMIYVYSTEAEEEKAVENLP
jgi:hypothetical protein